MFRRFVSFALCTVIVFLIFLPQSGDASKNRTEAVTPAVIGLQIVKAAKAAEIVRAVYPKARVKVDVQANALIVLASADTINGIRAIAQGIDVKDPTSRSIDTVQMHAAQPADSAARLRKLFPDATFSVAANKTLIIDATPEDMTQIKALVATIDTPLPTPTPKPPYAPEAVRIMQNDPRSVARAVAKSVPDVRVSVSGPQLLLSGAPDDVTHAKALIAQLDQPQPSVQFTEVYRLRFVNASSVADLFKRSFRNIAVQVDSELNAISVFATASIQQRIADAVAQLDAGPSAPSQGSDTPSGGEAETAVVKLKAATPGANGAPSTSAQDIASTVTQALSGVAPDLKITVPPNSTRLVLTGSEYSIKQAKDLIAQLDTPDPLVALDTEVLEIDEGAESQLGLKATTASVATTFTETSPPPNADGSEPPMMKLQKFSRTPLSFSAELDFLLARNQARILEDPRLTTFSGHTASLRAGETVNILTTTGGGTGTVATTQVQSFQTGVTLDITPVVNDGDYITVALHPSVNTEAGISAAGVPNIQTRDATTTVGLHDGETIVIGGLIESDDSKSITKIPILGDLPLIGKLFQNSEVDHSRNELIVTVTPHIIRPGESGAEFRPSPLPTIPAAAPLPTLPPDPQLPTLPPNSVLPAASGRRMPAPVRVPLSRAAQNAASTQPSVGATSVPSPSAVSSPNALPSAFGQTNTYTYGQAPANNYAAANQPPQIFFVQVNPTVVKAGDPITISAITSTNVTSLSFGASAMSGQTQLSKVGQGQWNCTAPFSAAGLMNAGNVQMMLTATAANGTRVSLPIPMSLVQ